mmetsp:Transcript_29148/g.44070  ORF Transcript_29148/g.44070 Transcript_29148/m.44070 type:complete len:487 (-) Transcript_29148:87-1547(-)
MVIEVRSETSSAGSGLFANKDFEAGEVLVEEANPLVRLVPNSVEEESKLFNAVSVRGSTASRHNGSSFFSSINPPLDLPKQCKGKFQGMIQALACFVELSPSNCKSADLNGLYMPDLNSPTKEEETILVVCKEALKYLQINSTEGSKLKTFVEDRPDDARKVMLVWSCNSFQGGRIYAQQSRINHSCNPNAVIRANEDKQTVLAACSIKAGEEICISYLGLLLYADRPVRQAQLLADKHFQCNCCRCSQFFDPAAAIPCVTCHDRNGRYLDENVAYDDEENVNYMFPRQSLDFECSKCKYTTKLDTDEPSKEIFSAIKAVEGKIVIHLENIDEEQTQDEEAWETQLHQLTCSVAGANHWTTNMMSLTRLDRILKQHHTLMIQSGEPPGIEEIAETIDSLQRICRFVDGLELKLDIGHLLSDVVIGVARTLVGLGDKKSKAYASEWVGKIKNYSDLFETPGMQKVVATLLRAGDENDSKPQAKRQKT